MCVILFTLLGYLSGSVLYANVFGSVFRVRERYDGLPDRNPGAANAFQCGGFLCGALTLLCDVLKGFLPVFAYSLLAAHEAPDWGIIPVMLAPTAGHILPVLYGFRGGKGIAVSFGCLLGLFPDLKPALALAIAFIFFTAALRVNPHRCRTLAAYPLAAVLMALGGARPEAFWGYILIAAAVCLRVCFSGEKKEKLEVRLLWMR